MEQLKSLCEFNDLKSKSNGNLWVVGSKDNTTVLVFNGNKTDSEVKKAYTKEITSVKYFDVRIMRLKSFLKRNPAWS